MGTSLVVQWLRICASTAGGMGSIPGWGTKIPHAAQSSQKQTKKKINGNPWTGDQCDLTASYGHTCSWL